MEEMDYSTFNSEGKVSLTTMLYIQSRWLLSVISLIICFSLFPMDSLKATFTPVEHLLDLP